ncbi:hypothetical protein SLEP1_g24808 [Rubroshorea leprosula]|uniref:Uncharacterized protein n=1 Tax=Rubroshorea leprosula TaxID=152421 RepID=A0AAV5JP31_9ROSI|nr:hypothetical protein SLEP1_g24808 [Rubroshorea leprosula]
MATSAFKSTAKRTPIVKSTGENSSSSNRTSPHRRGRSLSRFSRRLPQADYDDVESTLAPPTRGRFVNKLRGSGFLETSLDDLATKLFDSSLRGRSNLRHAEVSLRIGGGDGGVSESADSRRRRSVSVAQYQLSGSESDLDHSHNSSKPGNIKSSMGGNGQISSMHKPTAPNHKPGLRKSLSQKDLKCHDGYSAEHPTGDVDTDLYRALQDLRYAVEKIKTKLEQKANYSWLSNDLLKSQNSDVLWAVSSL